MDTGQPAGGGAAATAVGAARADAEEEEWPLPLLHGTMGCGVAPRAAVVAAPTGGAAGAAGL